MKVVALTGPKGSGKDTVGQLIGELYPDYKVKTIAFADPVKKVVQHLFDLNPESVDQYDLFKRTDVEYSLPGHLSHKVPGRHLVREIGMLMRKYDERQFTDYVFDTITSDHARLTTMKMIYVITDMRFDNEYTMVKSFGGKIIKILRPNYHYDGHITERGFDDHLVDYKLMNDGDLEYLKTRVQIVMNSVLKEQE